LDIRNLPIMPGTAKNRPAQKYAGFGLVQTQMKEQNACAG